MNSNAPKGDPGGEAVLHDANRFPDRTGLPATPDDRAHLTVRVRSASGLALEGVAADVVSDHLMNRSRFPIDLELVSKEEAVLRVPPRFPASYSLVATAERHEPGVVTLGEIARQGGDFLLELAPSTPAGLAGIVVDEDSHPVGGTRIDAFVSGRIAAVARSTTDDMGVFRLPALPAASDLRLVCRTPSRGTFVFPAPGLAPGEQREAVRLVIPTQRVVELLVLDEATGAPVTDAWAEPQAAASGGADRAAGVISQEETPTDAAGRARLRIPRGDTRVRVWSHDHQTKIVTVGAEESAREVRLMAWEKVAVDLVPDEGTLVCGRIPIGPGRKLGGSVPAPDQLVEFAVDDAGNVEPGETARIVMARADDYPNRWTLYLDRSPPVSLFLVSGDDILGRCDVSSGDRAKMVVDAGRFCSRGSLRFRLTDDLGNAWAGSVALSLRRRRGRLAYDGHQSLLPFRSGLAGATAENGAFALHELLPGAYDLELVARISPRSIEVFRGEITIRSSEVLDLGNLAVPEPCALVVAPIAADGRSALCRVSLFSYEFERYVSLDSSRTERPVWTGRPTELRDLRPGMYRVDVRSDGYVPAFCEVWLSAESDAECAPILEPGVTVRVILPAASLLSRSWLVVRAATGAAVERLALEGAGDGFVHVTVPPGDLVFEVVDDDGLTRFRANREIAGAEVVELTGRR